MTAVSVIVPWRDSGCASRARNVWRVESYLRGVFPDSDVQLADDGGELWSRGQSIDQAVARARWDVLVVCDADVLVPHAQLWRAVVRAAQRPGLVVPFTRYRYLSPSATLDALTHSWLPFEQLPSLWSLRTAVGACVVFSRQTHELAAGHDPRFRGWGWQDKAFDSACSTLAGPLRRVRGDALHLWHPTDPTNSQGAPSLQQNTLLGRRYVAARGDQQQMRALIAERA